MTTYYLMNNEAERRMMIDSKPHAGCLVCDTTEAGIWIEAKKKFGFELTGTQQMMFDMKTKTAA